VLNFKVRISLLKVLYDRRSIDQSADRIH
jgi:hypothetical protein